MVSSRKFSYFIIYLFSVILLIFTFLTDYLVDEGTEMNTTSDILLERNREQSIVDLLVPCLSLLINMLHKLKVCLLSFNIHLLIIKQ